MANRVFPFPAGRPSPPEHVGREFHNVYLNDWDVESVRRHGAHGDGSSNDTKAFTRALDRITERGGGVLYLPAGSYNLKTWTSRSVNVPLVVIARPGTVLVTGVSGQDFVQVGDNCTRFTCDGVRFSTFDHVVQGSNTSTKLEHVTVSRCEFNSVDSGIHFPATSAGAQRFYATGNDIETFTENGVSFRADFDYALVEGNWIKDGNGAVSTTIHGIILGNNTYADQDTWLRGVVAHNTVQDVDAGAGNNAYGILYYGRNCVIQGNVVEEIDINSTDNAYGIYTKCRYGIIAGNVCRNAGWAANIEAKGNDRAGTSDPQGFAMQVLDNNVFTDRADSSGDTTGIQINREDTICMGNYVEGPNLRGINNGGGKNSRICNNYVTRLDRTTTASGPYGIQSTDANDVEITDNKIESVVSNHASGLPGGIHVRSTAAVSRVSISRNTIHTVTGSAANANSGIFLSRSSTNTLDQIDIRDNRIDATYNAIHSNAATNLTNCRIFENVLTNATNSGWNGNATGVTFRRNVGYVTENNGTATVASGTTSIAVSHGLAVTPALDDIQVTPTNNKGSAAEFWITSPTSTQFTINVDADPTGSGATFSWVVMVQ